MKITQDLVKFRSEIPERFLWTDYKTGEPEVKSPIEIWEKATDGGKVLSRVPLGHTHMQNAPHRKQASVFGSSSAAATIIDHVSRMGARVSINTPCRRKRDGFCGNQTIADALRGFSIRSEVFLKADPSYERADDALRNELIRNGNQFLRTQWRQV